MSPSTQDSAVQANIQRLESEVARLIDDRAEKRSYLKLLTTIFELEETRHRAEGSFVAELKTRLSTEAKKIRVTYNLRARVAEQRR